MADPAATNDTGLVHSPASPLADVRRTCVRIAASDATVLLTGETGTGKEVFARLLHSASPRAGRQFVPVNCGAIPEALLESELFGFVRGAFTGAVSARRGRVSLAEGGTLFLDEIGELPLSLQVKLLRLLQERTYEPVGSSDSVTANFRLVAATNRDLVEEVRLGRFRRDLYYRLHVCPVRLPPLRERRADITHLFFHFWNRRGEQRPVAPEVVRYLENYAWPGNVRELENLVERLSVCAEGRFIDVKDLPPTIRGELDEPDLPAPVEFREFTPTPTPAAMPTPFAIAPSAPIDVRTPVATATAPLVPAAAPEPLDDPSVVTHEILASARAASPPPGLDPSALTLPVDLPKLLRDLENAYINKALIEAGGNKKEASKLLGMGRTTLVEKLRRRNADASGI